MPDPIARAARRGAFERFCAEPVLLLGGGAALLLQLAQPAIAVGVARHSRVEDAPMRRLTGTLLFLTAEAFGDAADRAWAEAGTTAAHRRVRGDEPAAGGAYSADDPHLQRWVAATLLVAGAAAARRVGRGIAPADADAVVAGFGRTATSLGLPLDAWPSDAAAFRRRWARDVASIRVGPEARRVGLGLFTARRVPGVVRVLLPVVRLVSLDLLPAEVRRAYGVPWRRRERFAVELFWAVVAPPYRLAPAALRRVPARLLLARVRRSRRAAERRRGNGVSA